MIHLTDDTVSQHILSGSLSVIMFTYHRCGPSKMMVPIVEQLPLTPEFLSHFFTMDAESNYGIRMCARLTPTFIVTDSIKVISRLVGTKTQLQLLSWLQPYC